LNVQRVVIDYRTTKGKSLISVTASIDTINNFVNGKIDEKEFYERN